MLAALLLLEGFAEREELPELEEPPLDLALVAACSLEFEGAMALPAKKAAATETPQIEVKTSVFEFIAVWLRGKLAYFVVSASQK